MVREFKLQNEKGQEFSLMDIENSCLLTAPNGLGISYTSEYEQIGNTFVQTIRTFDQGQIDGELNFLNYDNYRKIIDFIENAEKLRLEYIIPYNNNPKTYYKDVEINVLSKSEIQPNGVMTEQVTINCLSLWYEAVNLSYNIIESEVENLIRWDFIWDSRFGGTADSEISLVNKGHVPAPIELEISGRVVNPYIKLLVEGQEYQRVTFDVEIGQYEKLLYGSKEDNFYILKQNEDGTTTSLFDLDVINFDNDNVIRIPRNKSCKLQIYAETEITAIKAMIYIYYKAV
ncbi:MAG: phage baseplate protein [Acutalibacteraceae bacterium]|nr:phage baseplate protein [Acutalibacteraceae bacterium]